MSLISPKVSIAAYLLRDFNQILFSNFRLTEFALKFPIGILRWHVGVCSITCLIPHGNCFFLGACTFRKIYQRPLTLSTKHDILSRTSSTLTHTGTIF